MHRSFRILTLALAAAVAFSAPARADEAYYLAVDVPARLGAYDFTPNQVLRHWNGLYAAVATLDPSVTISAFALKGDGTVLFAPESPVTLGGVTYEPRDIVACKGATCSAFLTGAAVGIPAGTAIDALALDGGGNPVVSFDVPVTLGGTDYAPSDLVRFVNGTASLVWSGAAAGIPAGTNVTGYGTSRSGGSVFAFDIPVQLGALAEQPGDLATWNGSTNFSLFMRDAAWPPDATISGIGFAPGAGYVPDGRDVPGTQLKIRKAGAGLALTWGASCNPKDGDYAIYEGALGNFTSHVPNVCSTGGLTTATIAPLQKNAYYLVVARNAYAEGSPGFDSRGVQRPQGANACAPLSAGSCP